MLIAVFQQQYLSTVYFGEFQGSLNY